MKINLKNLKVYVWSLVTNCYLPLDTDFVLWLLLLLLLLYLWLILIIIIQYVCLLSQAFLPGTSLEPAVIPSAQASSFTLQYFPYYV